MDDQRIISARHAADELDMDGNTLRKYARLCGITPSRVPGNLRLRVYSADDLRMIRQRYADSRRASADVLNAPRPSADLASRLATLEAAFAQLRDRAPYLFTERIERTASAQIAPVTRSAGAEWPDEPADDVRRVPRQNRSTARPTVPTRPLTQSGLPAGLVSWRTFADAHGIPQRTVKNAIDDEKLPLVRGQWQMRSATGGYYLEMALDAAGQRAFYERWSHRADFVACAQCPHRVPLLEEETLAEVAGVAAAVEEE